MCCKGTQGGLKKTGWVRSTLEEKCSVRGTILQREFRGQGEGESSPQKDRIKSQ